MYILYIKIINIENKSIELVVDTSSNDTNSNNPYKQTFDNLSTIIESTFLEIALVLALFSLVF